MFSMPAVRGQTVCCWWIVVLLAGFSQFYPRVSELLEVWNRMWTRLFRTLFGIMLIRTLFRILSVCLCLYVYWGCATGTFKQTYIRHTFRPFSKHSILQESIDGHCMRNKSPYVAISKFQQCTNLWWYCANFRLSFLFLAHRRCKRHLTNLFLSV